MMPLEGMRLLDLSNVMAGPFCCYQLALLGAEVIKVEQPGSGDLARMLGADAGLNAGLMGASFLAQNAGKKSVTLNLKDSRGREILYGLIESSDALLEAFRPGVMERLGLGAQDVRGRFPRLVYCSLSGFGQTGPLAHRPAYDQIIQGLSGIMSVTGDEENAPLRVGFPVSDATAGLTAAMAISAALVRSVRSGEGATIDVSMLDASISVSAWVVSNWMIAGEIPRPMGNENRTAAPSGTYRTRVGLLNIAANKQDQWERLAELIGRPDLRDDPRFRQRDARKKNRDALKELVEEALQARPATEWEDILSAAGVPVGAVLDVPDAVSHEQVRHRNLFRTYDQVAGVGRAVTVSRGGFLFPEEGRPDLPPPPALGQDNDAVFGALGIEGCARKE